MNSYDLDRVFSKAELPEVARRLGMNVERIGANLLTKCPFHEDTRPSLVLYPTLGGTPSHFHCFSCNAHGQAVDLIKMVQGTDFMPAVDWLARTLGIAPERDAFTRGDSRRSTREDAIPFAQRIFDQQHGMAGLIDWCKNRGFDYDFAYNFGLRCLPFGSVLIRSMQSESYGRQTELIDGLIAAGLLIRLRPESKTSPQSSLNLNEQFRDYFHDGRILIPIRSARNELVGFAGRFYSTKKLSKAADTSVAKYLLTPGFHKNEVLFNAGNAQNMLRAAVKGAIPKSGVRALIS